MLHELLFALSGCPGDIFTLNDKNEIQVTNVISFCHPSEKEVLNRICQQIATLYFRILQFTNDANGYNSPQSSRSLYMKAFCDGLDKVLKPYREALIKLEVEILNDCHLTVSYIQASLNEYCILFPYLMRLINEVASKEVFGCEILRIIHNHCECGIAFVSKAMRLLYQTCNGVMINQLYAFLIHGIIQDPYKEFFVQICENETDNKIGLPEAEANVRHRLDIQIESKSTFIIQQQKIPPFISFKTADTILFIGQTINMFNSNKEQFGKVVSVLQAKEEEYSKKLFHLITFDEPNYSDLEEAIDNIRACVAEHLWELVVESFDLIKHLQALKDLYLLGRGELYLSFLDQASHLMNEVPSTCIEHDIKTEFQMAARSVSMAEDSCFQKFRLSINNKNKKHRAKPTGSTFFMTNVSTAGTIWNYITLEYSPPGILKLLFTPDILDKYNAIFRFLLYVKRVQLELQKCWANQMSGKHKEHNLCQWHLRSCMAFIIDNLQYYLQVDVLENQFHVLMENIKATRDFEKIEMVHVAYLNNILLQTFISMRKVSQCLQDFMQFCLNYCEEVKKFPNLKEHQLKHFQKSFRQRYTGLITILKLIGAHEISPHLAKFMLRINYNEYF